MRFEQRHIQLSNILSNLIMASFFFRGWGVAQIMVKPILYIYKYSITMVNVGCYSVIKMC